MELKRFDDWLETIPKDYCFTKSKLDEVSEMFGEWLLSIPDDIRKTVSECWQNRLKHKELGQTVEPLMILHMKKWNDRLLNRVHHWAFLGFEGDWYDKPIVFELPEHVNDCGITNWEQYIRMNKD